MAARTHPFGIRFDAGRPSPVHEVRRHQRDLLGSPRHRGVEGGDGGREDPQRRAAGEEAQAAEPAGHPGGEGGRRRAADHGCARPPGQSRGESAGVGDRARLGHGRGGGPLGEHPAGHLDRFGHDRRRSAGQPADGGDDRLHDRADAAGDVAWVDPGPVFPARIGPLGPVFPARIGPLGPVFPARIGPLGPGGVRALRLVVDASCGHQETLTRPGAAVNGFGSRTGAVTADQTSRGAFRSMYSSISAAAM